MDRHRIVGGQRHVSGRPTVNSWRACHPARTTPTLGFAPGTDTLYTRAVLASSGGSSSTPTTTPAWPDHCSPAASPTTSAPATSPASPAQRSTSSTTGSFCSGPDTTDATHIDAEVRCRRQAAVGFEFEHPTFESAAKNLSRQRGGNHAAPSEPERATSTPPRPAAKIIVVPRHAVTKQSHNRWRYSTFRITIAV